MSSATSPNDYSRAHIYSNTAAPESTASPPSLTVPGANCSVGGRDPIATRFRQYIDAKGLAGKVFVAAKPNWVVMSTQPYEGPDVASARLPELVGNRADYPKLDDDEWHCFTGSQYDAKTREWKMSKLPVHRIVPSFELLRA